MAAVQQTLTKVPNKIVDLAMKGGSFAVGATGGAYATEILNAQFPQQQLSLGNVSFGVGDAIVAIGGTGAYIYFAKKGSDTMKQLIDFAAAGAVGGWAVNKIAQAIGYNPPFQSIIPTNGSARVRSRNLYQGQVIPSSAYRARSRAVVGGSGGAYYLNRA